MLLDVPRLRGVPWLEPGEHVFTEDLEGAEREQGVTVGEGDILLVRTGHARRHLELGPWDTDSAKAGLHPTWPVFWPSGALPRSDRTATATRPRARPRASTSRSTRSTLNAMGVHLLDYLQFEDLAPACERERRWEFLFTAAPLRLVGGTGSPLNPIAIL